MKRLLLSFFAMLFFFASCSTPVRLMNSATYQRNTIAQPVVALFADLEVSPEKVSYLLLPTKTVLQGGYDNVINTAVKEALMVNGNADVMVALETQVKYDGEGQIESVVVVGYPVKYVNFRNPGDEYLKLLVESPNTNSDRGDKFGKILQLKK
jgi:hypothetical protein